MNDNISNPKHYTEGRKYEPRKVIEDWELDFYLGNALKYIARAGRKNDIVEDLLKARQYIDFELEKIENKKEKPSLEVCASCYPFGEKLVDDKYCPMINIFGYNCCFNDCCDENV